MNVISKMLAGVLLSLPVLSFAETHTLQTYYPAPTGIYNTVTVTSNTVLGRNGGIVTVGSSANASELNVNGPVKINGGVLVPARLSADPTASSQLVEGAIYYNTTTQKHRIYSAGIWKDMGGGSGVLVDSGLVTESGGSSTKTFFLPAGTWKVTIITGIESGTFDKLTLTIDGTQVYTSPGIAGDPVPGTNWIPLVGSKDNVAGNRNITCSFNAVFTPVWGVVPSLMTMIATAK